MDAYLAKPVEMRSLFETLERLVPDGGNRVQAEAVADA